MTYSSYLNDKELRAAADRYTEMYGGQFECADTGDVLLYRKNEGDTYISVKADYPVPLFTKRLRQATMHKYTVNLLTLCGCLLMNRTCKIFPASIEGCSKRVSAARPRASQWSLP